MAARRATLVAVWISPKLAFYYKNNDEVAAEDRASVYPEARHLHDAARAILRSFKPHAHLLPPPLRTRFRLHLQTLAGTLRGIYSPLRSLPLEVLAHIFNFAADYYNPVNMRSTPWSLTRVSRQWRWVARTLCPALWSRIDICTGYSAFTRGCGMALHRALELAQWRPIDLYLSIHVSSNPIKAAEDLANASAALCNFLNVLLHHSPRWRSADIVVPGGTLDLLIGLLPRHSAAMQLLEQLRIEVQDPGPATRRFQLFPWADMPNLWKVRLSSDIVLPLPSNQIERVRLVSDPRVELDDLYVLASDQRDSLCALDVDYVKEDDDPDGLYFFTSVADHPDEESTFPSVTSLTTGSLAVLKTMAFPNLFHLTLKGKNLALFEYIIHDRALMGMRLGELSIHDTLVADLPSIHLFMEQQHEVETLRIVMNSGKWVRWVLELLRWLKFAVDVDAEGKNIYMLPKLQHLIVDAGSVDLDTCRSAGRLGMLVCNDEFGPMVRLRGQETALKLVTLDSVVRPRDIPAFKHKVLGDSSDAVALHVHF